MSEALRFEVLGTPIPQGSHKMVRHGSRFKIIDQQGPKLEAWREAIGWEARQEIQHRGLRSDADGLFRGPVALGATFRLPRPKSVSRARRPLPTVPPDLSKLVRALEDALTGIVWRDDAQVVRCLETWKRYVYDGEEPGAVVEVREI